MLSSYERKVIYGSDTQIKWFVSKILRIIPMYYFFLIIQLIFSWRGGVGGTIIANVITHFLFVNSLFPSFTNSILGVEWFIGVLVFFYSITPVMYKVFNDVTKSFFGLIVMSIITLCANHACVNYLFSHISVEKRYCYDAWIGGWFPPMLLDVYCAALIWYWVAKKEDCVAKLADQSRKMLSFSLLALFAILFIADTIGELRIWGISSKNISVFTFSILIAALYIYPNRLMVNGAFAFLGKYTYGIFLSHVIIINLMAKISMRFNNAMAELLVKYFVSVAGATIVSFTLTELLERPTLRRINKLGEKNGDRKEE